MPFKVRHIPTGLYIQRNSYSYHLTKNGRIWVNKPNSKYFPRYVWEKGYGVHATTSNDFEIVEFDLVEKTQ